MVATISLSPPLPTVERLVDLIEADGLPLEAAVWTPDDVDQWRLYLVPRAKDARTLRSMVEVASTISRHGDELPDRDDLLFSVVDKDHPVIRAIDSLHLGRVSKTRKVEGVYGNGRYFDRAYVFRLH